MHNQFIKVNCGMKHTFIFIFSNLPNQLFLTILFKKIIFLTINTLFYCRISFFIDTRHFFPSLTHSQRSSYPPPSATVPPLLSVSHTKPQLNISTLFPLRTSFFSFITSLHRFASSTTQSMHFFLLYSDYARFLLLQIVLFSFN